ncbi:hypothetical protein, partial [Rhodovulum sulfidophilum]|uniref:hypothetical protein n=1 Tax=Rhodovulum sulfidophilum TaxID=35806 RepID=UPI0009621AFB
MLPLDESDPPETDTSCRLPLLVAVPPVTLRSPEIVPALLRLPELVTSEAISAPALLVRLPAEVTDPAFSLPSLVTLPPAAVASAASSSVEPLPIVTDPALSSVVALPITLSLSPISRLPLARFSSRFGFAPPSVMVSSPSSA